MFPRKRIFKENNFNLFIRGPIRGLGLIQKINRPKKSRGTVTLNIFSFEFFYPGSVRTARKPWLSASPPRMPSWPPVSSPTGWSPAGVIRRRHKSCCPPHHARAACRWWPPCSSGWLWPGRWPPRPCSSSYRRPLETVVVSIRHLVVGYCLQPIRHGCQCVFFLL